MGVNTFLHWFLMIFYILSKSILTVLVFSDQAEARRVKNREQRRKREERQIKKRQDLLTLTKDEEITQEA